MRSDSTEAFLADPYSYLTDRAVRYARTTRYLRHRPDECLKSRADDITGNLWTTDASGAVVRLSDPESREYFMCISWYSI